MIDKFMGTSMSAKEYTTALLMFDPSIDLTTENVKALETIYANALPEMNSTYLHAAMLIDMVRFRNLTVDSDAKLIDMSQADIDAMLMLKDFPTHGNTASVEKVEAITDVINDDKVSLDIRILIARLALDDTVMAENFSDVREYAQSMAELLRTVDDATIESCSVLAKEVKIKWW